MSNETDTSIIARVRRAMPRNQDVMRVCDLAEQGLVRLNPPPVKKNWAEGTVFDKKAYQREYMRKRRAKSNA